jgi:hypothetical protein
VAPQIQLERTIDMTKTLFAIVLLLALVGIAPVMVPGGSPAPKPNPVVTPVPPANCPRIHEAAEALETALRDLESARHDFCGHKREAIEATRHALKQLREAENCDKCR